MCSRLTTANKNEFVELKARYIMCEQRQEQLDALRDVFRSVSHTAILHTHISKSSTQSIESDNRPGVTDPREYIPLGRIV